MKESSFFFFPAKVYSLGRGMKGSSAKPGRNVETRQEGRFRARHNGIKCKDGTPYMFFSKVIAVLQLAKVLNV